MTSEVEERPRLVSGGTGVNGLSQRTAGRFYVHRNTTKHQFGWKIKAKLTNSIFKKI